MKNTVEKDSLLKSFEETPLTIGETIYLVGNRSNSCEILAINGDTIDVKKSSSSNNITTVPITDIESRLSKYYIGSNPFNQRFNSIRIINYSLESILGKLGLLDGDHKEKYLFNNIQAKSCNWNPFIYKKDGGKEYYQRDFVWTIEENQLLIESIYKDISCGVILVRNRSWEFLEKIANSGETEIYFHDIVDGKQRLNAISKFVFRNFIIKNRRRYVFIEFLHIYI